MKSQLLANRRNFLKTAAAGLAAAAAHSLWSRRALAALGAMPAKTAQVTLMSGQDHADLIFQSLKPLSRDISQAIGSRRVVIKPNNVNIERPLCATHADCLEGIIEFLKSIGKMQNAIIAESAASGPTLEGFANYGYPRVADKYGVKLADLDQQEFEEIFVFDETDFRPHALRTSKMLLDHQNNFIISATRFKTHDRAVATLSLKNIVFGAPIKDAGFRWGGKGRAGAKNDKPIAHGSGYRAINYNLFALAPKLHPDLAVLDGFEGMEGNGPVNGTPVAHRVAVASRDWLAADRVAVELMGIDFAKVGYLNYCAQGRLGEASLEKIEVMGETIANHIKPYKLHENVEKQLIWRQPPQPA